MSFSVVVGLVLVSAAAPAMAQPQLERFERQLEQINRETRLEIDTSVPPDQRALFEYGAYVTSSIISIDDPTAKTHALAQQDVNAYARLNIDGVHDFFLRVRSTYKDWFHNNAFDNNNSDWIEPTLDRGTYTFDLARYFEAYQGKHVDYNVNVTGGRQLIHWANGLVLSQDMDGAIIDLSMKQWDLTILAAITRGNDVDFDSSRPDFNSKTHRGFYGAMLSDQIDANHKPYIYGLVQEDYNPDEVLGALGTTTHFDYNSWYLGIGSHGNFTDQILYGAELVYEGGSTLSNSFTGAIGTATFAPVAQTRDSISAFAADFTLDYLPNDPNRSRLSGEIVLASGDNDRQVSSTTFGGNKPGTTDHGFNGLGLINTGLEFVPSVSNLVEFRLGASTFPLPNDKTFSRLQVGGNVIFFNKMTPAAPIDEPSGKGFYLGTEADLFANWQITSDLSWTVRYGIFFPGSTLASDNEPRHFAYMGLTFSF